MCINRIKQEVEKITREELIRLFFSIAGLVLFILSINLLLSITLSDHKPLSEQLPSKDMRWASTIYGFELASLSLILIYMPSFFSFKDDKWKTLTKILFLFTILFGTGMVLLLYIPDLPGDIQTISGENVTIRYQWRSYTQYSDTIIPGNKLCVMTEITNNKPENISISFNTTLTVPDGTIKNSSSLVTQGPIRSNDTKRFPRTGCVHIIEPGLNSWHIDFFVVYDNETLEYLFSHDLFPMVRSHESYFERMNWLYGSFAGIILFLTLIPKFVLDIKTIWRKRESKSK